MVMNRQLELEKNWDQSRAFDLKRLMESRLHGTVVDDFKKSLYFEYDEEIPKIVIGQEKALGELLTVVFNYSWERIYRGGLDVAVQGFDAKDDAIKIQFSFCERFVESSRSDRLDRQRFFRNAEDDGSDLRLMNQLCGKFGIELITKIGPLGERFMAFVVELELESPYRLKGYGLHCLRGKRLLLVEDNDLYREVLKRYFIRWGIEVEDAGSAEKAILLMDGLEPFDFGVFDNSLPGRSGSELARYCRLFRQRNEMQIISLSGGRETKFDSCFDESLAMPVMPETLKKILARFTSGRSQQ